MDTMRTLLIFGFFVWNSASGLLLLAPDYVRAELRGNADIPIQWVTAHNWTLTLTHIVSTGETEVLVVNENDTISLNSWENKVTVDLPNVTSLTTIATVRLSSVSFEDEGMYHIKVKAEDSPEGRVIQMRLVTYAMPISLKISRTPMVTEVNEYTEVDFVCEGNIGKPVGTLRLLRASLQYPEYLASVDTVTPSELTEAKALTSLVNGTNSVKYAFNVNVSRIYNASVFVCTIEHSVPSLTVTKSNEIQLHVNYNGEIMIQCVNSLDPEETPIIGASSRSELFDTLIALEEKKMKKFSV